MSDMTTDSNAIDAEIFSVGRWNGERFTRRDLHEIARNFRRLHGQLRPPLKFGHDEGQTLLGQLDGDPALGWVERLWVRGGRLMARFSGVPALVHAAIRAGRYRRVSAELYLDVRRGGRRLGKALKAVALLGADLPAVTNLADLTAYLSRPDAQSAPGGAEPEPLALAEARAFALPVTDGRIGSAASSEERAPDPTSRMEESTMSDVTSNPAPAGELQAELAELRAYKARSEQRHDQERRRRQDEAFRDARGIAVAFCEAQVAAGRLTPHLGERLVKELDGQVRSFGEGQALRVSFDWLRRFIESTPAALPAGELAHAVPERSAAAEAMPAGDENPSLTLARLASNTMAELRLDYGEAAAYVLRTRPALARAYRQFTLSPG